MALVAISTLYPDIMPAVPGCPAPVVRQAVRDAAREFCADSLCWRATLAAIDVADQADYALTAPTAHADIFEVRSLVYNNEDDPLTFYTEEQLDYQFPGWKTETGAPEAFTILTDGTVTLVPRPTEALAGGLVARVALVPSASATQVDSVITLRWREALAHGALARLKAMPGKAWTDLGAVEAHYAFFRDGVRKARTAAASGFQARPPRTVRYGGI